MKLAVVFSLIVSSCLAQPLKFLGVDRVVADPPLALPRTALDVLHPGVGYLGHLGHLGHHVGVGYPWLAAGHHYHHLRLPTYFPGLHFAPAAVGFNLPVHLGLPTITDAVATKDEAEAAVDEVVDVVDVSEEEEAGTGASLITIQQAVGNIPAPPGGLTRNPGPSPILPAGIVQATQPKFVHVLFQNPKASPHFPFLHNSKISPILNEIREDSAGILRV